MQCDNHHCAYLSAGKISPIELWQTTHKCGNQKKSIKLVPSWLTPPLTVLSSVCLVEIFVVLHDMIFDILVTFQMGLITAIWAVAGVIMSLAVNDILYMLSTLINFTHNWFNNKVILYWTFRSKDCIMVNLNSRQNWANSTFKCNGALDVSTHFEWCSSPHLCLTSSIVVQSGIIKRIIEKCMCRRKFVLGPSDFMLDILLGEKPAEFGGHDQ